MSKRYLTGILAFFLLTCCARTPDRVPVPHSMAGQTGAVAAPPATLDAWARDAQLFAGLGSFHRQIKSTSDQAQQYFDQGMRLMWAFNHDEASRSFARAAQLDPRCAMCLWGLALTVGPNYNMPMMADIRAALAYESVARAAELLDGASPAERALIGALKARYPTPTALDPQSKTPP